MVTSKNTAVMLDSMRYQSTEDDIIALLADAGSDARMVRLGDVHLHAIERPGWKQIFRFVVSSVDDNDQSPQFGIFLGDERSVSTIELFDLADERDERLRSVSKNLITSERTPRSRMEAALLGAFLVLMIALAIVAVMNPL